MHVIIIFVLITGLIYDPKKNQKRLDSWLTKKKSTHQQSIKLRTKTNLIWFWQILSRYQRQDSRPTLATCRIVELWHVDSMMRYSVPCAVLYFCVFVVGTHGGQVSTGPLQTVLLDRAVSSQNHDSESELETVRWSVSCRSSTTCLRLPWCWNDGTRCINNTHFYKHTNTCLHIFIFLHEHIHVYV